MEDSEELEELLVPASNNNTLLAIKTLIEKIITSMSLNKSAVKVLAKACNNYDNLQISDLGFNKFLLTFSHENHSKEVKLKASWYVMNHLL